MFAGSVISVRGRCSKCSAGVINVYGRCNKCSRGVWGSVRGVITRNKQSTTDQSDYMYSISLKHGIITCSMHTVWYDELSLVNQLRSHLSCTLYICMYHVCKET